MLSTLLKVKAAPNPNKTVPVYLVIVLLSDAEALALENAKPAFLNPVKEEKSQCSSPVKEEINLKIYGNIEQTLQQTNLPNDEFSSKRKQSVNRQPTFGGTIDSGTPKQNTLSSKEFYFEHNSPHPEKIYNDKTGETASNSRKPDTLEQFDTKEDELKLFNVVGGAAAHMARPNIRFAWLRR